MSILTKLYNNSPLFFQNLMVSAYGYQWQQRRYGGIFEQEYEVAKEREHFAASQWQQYQEEQLQKMLVHAFIECPYYHEKFTQAGLSTNTLQKINLNNLSCIPVTSKEDVRKFGTTTMMAAHKEKGGSFFSSSGSTGTPVQIYYSTNMHQRWFALHEARVKNWAGVNRLMGRGMIGGRRIIPDAANKPPFYRYNYFEKQVYFSAYHISPRNIKNYLQAFEGYSIEYMTGYAVSNYILARMFAENGLKPPLLKAVLTSSEKLTDEMRKTFTEVYGCKTFDAWSGMEYCGLISECEHGSLHISPDAGIIEVLDENMQPVAAGKSGSIYCTGFLNYDQPLIRYAIGDNIVLSNKTCNCGRQMPIVEEITGRIEDIVYGKDGREMVRFHGIFVGLKTVKLSQVIQQSLDEILIKIVPDEKLAYNEKQLIIERMKSQLGEINIVIEEVNELPKTNNGKTKSIISFVKKSPAKF